MIVLDTHALVWWVSGGGRLSPNARDAIERELPRAGVLVSSITTWEIASLVARDRLALHGAIGAWIADVAAIDGLRFAPVDNSVALETVALPGTFHRDPADRIIVATARRHGAALVTADERIRQYPHVATIW